MIFLSYLILSYVHNVIKLKIKQILLVPLELFIKQGNVNDDDNEVIVVTSNIVVQSTSTLKYFRKYSQVVIRSNNLHW